MIADWYLKHDGKVVMRDGTHLEMKIEPELAYSIAK